VNQGANANRPAACLVRHAPYPDLHVRRDAETLAQAGYDVTVVALRRPGEAASEILNGVHVRRLPVEHHRGGLLRYVWEYAAFFVLALLTVAVLHLRRRFRVVEVDNMPDPLVFAALVPKLTGARVIFYVFDNVPDLLAHERGLPPDHRTVRLLALVERLAAAFADRVLVTQETACRVMQARGTPAAKLSVVLNCPDEALFPRRRPRPLAPRDGSLRIVTHGAVLKRYGIHRLIEAMPRVAAEVPGARADVFGSGEYRADLEALAQRLGVADRVRFRGHVPLAELVASIGAADVGYVGMQCDLMLSNKLMEYVALGVPAVVARWSTYEHYFPDDAVNYFSHDSAADLASTILAVYRDPAAARERAERAAELYGDYRWGVQRQAYLDVYAELAAPPALTADRAIDSRTPATTR